MIPGNTLNIPASPVPFPVEAGLINSRQDLEEAEKQARATRDQERERRSPRRRSRSKQVGRDVDYIKVYKAIGTCLIHG